MIIILYNFILKKMNTHINSYKSTSTNSNNQIERKVFNIPNKRNEQLKNVSG
jgi:hypothetical protein